MHIPQRQRGARVFFSLCDVNKKKKTRALQWRHVRVRTCPVHANAHDANANGKDRLRIPPNTVNSHFMFILFLPDFFFFYIERCQCTESKLENQTHDV
jgi:hypothetical protein